MSEREREGRAGPVRNEFFSANNFISIYCSLMLESCLLIRERASLCVASHQRVFATTLPVPVLSVVTFSLLSGHVFLFS